MSFVFNIENNAFAQATALLVINKCESPISITILINDGCPNSSTFSSHVISQFTVAGYSSLPIPPFYSSSNAYWTSANVSATINGGTKWVISTTPIPYCPGANWHWGNASSGLTAQWFYPADMSVQLVIEC